MTTRTKKLLIGAGIGCGGLLLLLLIAFISFAVWLNQPGELLEPERLLGTDTLGFAEWTLTLEDPGTREFVEGILAQTQAAPGEAETGLPPQLEQILLGWQNKRNRKSLDELFPLSVGWTLRAGEGAEADLQLLSVSLEKAGNQLVFADWMLGFTLGFTNKTELQRVSYRDETLYRFALPGRDPLTVFLRGNDVFFTYDLDTARQAVDRLSQEAPAGAGSSPLEELFHRTTEDHSLRGALTNERGEIFRNWRKLAVHIENPEALEEMTGQLRGLSFAGDLSGEGHLEGRISLLAPDPEWAAAHEEAALDALRAGLDYERLAIEASASTESAWIHIDFRLDGFFELLERLDDGRIVVPE